MSNRRAGGIRNYLVNVFNGMAQGLFASLLIGLIIRQIGNLTENDLLISFGNMAQCLMGPAIGAGVAYSVGAPPLGIFSSIIVGAIGAGSISFQEGAAVISVGEPVGAFVASLAAAEISKLIQGKTSVDIVLVPITTIVLVVLWELCSTLYC